METAHYDFGLIGLGVMGRNFILNVAEHGFSACGYNRDPKKVEALLEEGKAFPVTGTSDLAAFVRALKTPRKIMLLVSAGGAVDAVIEQLIPLIEKGDLIIDGGNSYFPDTNRRLEYLAEKGIRFMGMGVSGGAEGARRGPSIMPGGDAETYEMVRPILEAVAAKVNNEPCVAYLGATSAGNYVKMVHNGIEYGMMQLIAEIYDLLKQRAQLSNPQLADTLGKWNEGRLQSFLIEITAKIFSKADELNQSGELVDKILDKAKQKGTGKWTSQNAMDLGMPVPTIDAAVTMRETSSFKALREELAHHYPKPTLSTAEDTAEFVKHAENALLFAFVVSYAQGMALLQAASEEYNYHLNMVDIARIWRGGCIIRAALLEDIMQAYTKTPDLPSLLLDDAFRATLQSAEASIRYIVQAAVSAGIPCTAFAASLNWFDSFTSGRLPVNLVQAQRDFFGSHTYERTDREGIFHTEW